MTKETLEEFILSFPDVDKSKPFGEDIQVYSFGEGDDAEMFALIHEDRNPLRISLRCDSRLSRLLREKYEEVMPGDRLDRKKWITIILSGQLAMEEVKDLIRHSYIVVSG